MVKVAFVHPDLGIGGAEQLVVNLALLCRKNGWDVNIITPYFDPNRAFEPVKDGTLNVEVHGNWFPRRIFKRFQALCEYIRMFIASLYLILFGGYYDLVIVDQIPVALPLLMLRYRTLFYCHFPDKLLCYDRSRYSRILYRFFIDTFEEFCLYFASIIVVNSKYTLEVYKKNFTYLNKLRSTPKILYPCSDFASFDNVKTKDSSHSLIDKSEILDIKGLEKLKSLFDKDKPDCYNIKDSHFLLSLNRYEKKKNHDLAIDAFIEFMNYNKKINEKDSNKYFLIIAGGYDERLGENRHVFVTLYNKDFQGYKKNIYFLRSIPGNDRTILLKCADIVLYTPKNEHFGIVPCEAMYCGATVIAHKSGGPIETIQEGYGYLLENDNPKEWGKTIYNYYNISSDNQIFRNKEKLKEYVLKNYDLERMNVSLLEILNYKYPNIFKLHNKKNQ